MLQQLGVIGIHADLIGTPTAATTRAAVAQARALRPRSRGARRREPRADRPPVFSRDLRLNLYEHRIDELLAACLADCASAARRATSASVSPAPRASR
jgi:hypothetical protein